MAVKINREKCITCGGCTSICPVNALELRNGEMIIDKEKCIECGKCVSFCPVNALKIDE